MTAVSENSNTPIPSDKRADIWISYFEPDLLLARRLAAVLGEFGYKVAPYRVLNHANATREKLTPNDAKCVIALWTHAALDAQQLQADARTAGSRQALIEIGLRGACPTERFSDEALIGFERLELPLQGQQRRDLLARVRASCGAPPKRHSDAVSIAPVAFAAIATMAGFGAGAKMIGDMAQDRHEAMSRPFTQPAQPEYSSEVLAVAKRPSLTPTADMPIRMGGPNDYIAEDLGTAPAPALPIVEIDPVEPPTPKEREAQGPEE